jgi:ABC-type multidrug transport system ATPase subunit
VSLQIDLQNISKKYSNHYIIKDFSYQFKGENSYAILGSNGSGKSTLVKLLSGLHTPSKGDISYKQDDKLIPIERIFSHVTLAAPWSDVIEDLTLRECISFQFKFRKSLANISIAEMITISGLGNSADKLIHQYSSGMKQRVRLLLAFFTESDVLLLDEPTSNLDAAGKQWYRNLVEKYSGNRLMIVASNHLAEEYDFCKELIEL